VILSIVLMFVNVFSCCFVILCPSICAFFVVGVMRLRIMLMVVFLFVLFGLSRLTILLCLM